MINHEEPDEAVVAYYDEINRREFGAAWRRLSAGMQKELRGFATWLAGYRFTEAVEAIDAIVVERTKRRATVAVRVESTDEDACENTVRQTFAGSWSLRHKGAGWRLADAVIEKVGGDELVVDHADCPRDPSENRPRWRARAGPGRTGPTVAPYPPVPEKLPPDYGYDYDRPYPDLDCEDVSGPVAVGVNDPHGLDGDGDGIGCE